VQVRKGMGRAQARGESGSRGRRREGRLCRDDSPSRSALGDGHTADAACHEAKTITRDYASINLRCISETVGISECMQLPLLLIGVPSLSWTHIPPSPFSRRPFVPQSQAVAWTLREAAAEAGPGGNVVAIVNLGALASLRRNWEVRAAAAPQAVGESCGPDCGCWWAMHRHHSWWLSRGRGQRWRLTHR
jgi:hypothetical protein